eukprot:4233549-Pleurochrysis_carterae.AAC.3
MAAPLLSSCVQRLLACLATCYRQLLLIAPPALATMHSDKVLLHMLCVIDHRCACLEVGSGVLHSARC